VDSANKYGSLLEVVQVLTDLKLTIKRAYISSDGEWFMDGECSAGSALLCSQSPRLGKFKKKRVLLGGGGGDAKLCLFFAWDEIFPSFDPAWWVCSVPRRGSGGE
jgi:hypothetical protein